jgi:signal transduction histidine kinase
LIGGITIVPLATLSWLGWRLLAQDRVLERQQVQQRTERAADMLVAALQRAIAVSEQRLAAGAGPEGGAVVVTFRDGRVDASPPHGLAYFPVIAPLPEATTAAFANGDDLEFRRRDAAAASTFFGALAESSDRAVRAGALVRLGRTLRRMGRVDEALSAYDRLSEMDDVAIGGAPAGLVGTYARCRLLEERQSPGLRTEADRLQRQLQSSRWALTEPVYALYSADAARWAAADSRGPVAQEVLADAVGRLWERWTAARTTMRGPSGRESATIDGQPVAILWQTTGDSLRALVATSAYIDSEWLPSLTAIAREQHVAFGLRAADGAQMFGTLAVGGSRAARAAADAGLPWSIVTASLDPPIERRDFARRQRLLVAGFVLLAVMALVAGYAIVRAVGRELAVARLQSDFVAAVSHEFRTPLTALRQFTDMLREQPTLDEVRRRTAYDAQSRATDRLTRLVESLLDFGRMEAGAHRYRFERHDAAELVRRVVDDFRGEPLAAGHPVAFRTAGAAPIETDDEALTRAVWNLLENAAKYSTAPAPIEIGVATRDGHVLIAVRDHGIGVPPHEREAVFAKFYRGEQARTGGIRGTGIGLTMAHEIVQAHRGRIAVESEPGHGSTFTIVLPAGRAPA